MSSTLYEPFGVGTDEDTGTEIKWLASLMDLMEATGDVPLC